MNPEPGTIRVLIASVRSRWRRLIVFKAIVRAALAAAARVVGALVLARAIGRR